MRKLNMGLDFTPNIHISVRAMPISLLNGLYCKLFIAMSFKATKFGRFVKSKDALKRCKFCNNRERDPSFRSNHIGKIPNFEF